MASQEFEQFHSALKEYYNSETFSDAIIVCNDQQFKVHRMILSAHSKYFAVQFSGDWKESLEQKIEIKDFDTAIVEAMLRFMYSFDYTNVSGVSSMVYDAQVYQIADKYDIPALKASSADKFCAAIATGWSMDDFPIAVTVVYESTPPTDRKLRDLAVEISHKNIDNLIGNFGFCELLRSTPDFSADLIPFLCGKSSKEGDRYQCPSCCQQFISDFKKKGQYYCPRCSAAYSGWHSYRVE